MLRSPLEHLNAGAHSEHFERRGYEILAALLIHCVRPEQKLCWTYATVRQKIYWIELSSYTKWTLLIFFCEISDAASYLFAPRIFGASFLVALRFRSTRPPIRVVRPANRQHEDLSPLRKRGDWDDERERRRSRRNISGIAESGS